jgi:hypothetical protein
MLAISSRAGTAGQAYRLEGASQLRRVYRVRGVLVADDAHIGQVMPRLPEADCAATGGPCDENEPLSGW